MSRFVGILLALALASFPFATSAQQAGIVNGQKFVPMNGWEPEDFRISCGNKEGVMSPKSVSLSCLGQNQANILEFEISLIAAAGYLESSGFTAPYHFGPVIDSFEEDSQPAIRVFTGADADSFADVEDLASSTSIECNREGYRIMNIYPPLIARSPVHTLSLVAAHELFHTVQPAIKGVMVPNELRYVECYPPRWITEATADAVGIDFMRRDVPGSYPPPKGMKGGANIVGARAYNLSLNHPGSTIGYNTNSFWMYLGDQFHNKNFTFIQRYLSIPAPMYESADGPKGDWLRWLDDRLQADNEVDTPLYLLYPRFLTFIAGEWAEGGASESASRVGWLTSTFGGCTTVTLTPEKPYVELNLEIRKVAGRCIEVSVEGIESADLASIKIGAETENVTIADSLHLGLAFTTDRTEFNCATATREGKFEGRREGCLIEPVTGVFGTLDQDSSAARMWHGSSLERGQGGLDDEPDTSVQNTYIMSYVPVKPWQSRLDGTPSANVKVGVGLEWSSLTVDGSNVNSGQDDGTRTEARTRSAAALGMHPLETDRKIPPSAGRIDDGPLGLTTDLNLSNFLGGGTINSILQGAMGPSLGTEVVTFRLAEVEVIPIDDVSPEEELTVVREFMVMMTELLPFGDKGTFDAGIMGTDKDDPNILYLSPKAAPAKLTVVENTRGAFHVKVDGIVCEMNLGSIQFGQVELCQRSFFVSGEMTKPFAYLYRAETELTAEWTTGEHWYDWYKVSRPTLSGMRSSLFGGSGISGQETRSNSNDGDGGAIQCQCTCPNVATPASDRCVGQCYAQLQSCEAVPQTSSPAQQMEKFTDLLSGRGLPADVNEMLISDFSNMSSETREYIIEQYNLGNM